MSAEHSARLKAAIANLRANGDQVKSTAGWEKAPGPFEAITRQMIEDLAAELDRVRDDNVWMRRLLIATVLVSIALKALEVR